MDMIEPLVLLIVFALLVVGAYWIFRPQAALFWRMERTKKAQQRIQREDALNLILQSENYGRPVTRESLAGALAISTAEAAEVLGALEQKELVQIVGQPLSTLEPGQKATVLSLTHSSRGSERRRFMDLGILPGTLILAERRSPSGDPTAYRIRDALIALRSEQAEKIRVKLIETPA